MSAYDEQCEAVGLVAGISPAGLSGAGFATQAEEQPVVTEGFVLDVLAAAADMALRSKRRQADLDARLRHAGIEAGAPGGWPRWNGCACRGASTSVVELSDGGVLLSVTAAGLDRLGGVRMR